MMDISVCEFVFVCVCIAAELRLLMRMRMPRADLTLARGQRNQLSRRTCPRLLVVSLKDPCSWHLLAVFGLVALTTSVLTKRLEADQHSTGRLHALSTAEAGCDTTPLHHSDNMFATRANQENAVYAQQTAAAAKNDNLKGLAPKTPGAKAPKTPFKKSLNDENNAFGPGKTGGKGKDGLFGDAKGGKAQSDAFVTPAGMPPPISQIILMYTDNTSGPRARAPLGNKTTNVKQTAFRTPGAAPEPGTSLRPTSPRLRRGRVKVLQSESEEINNDPAEREIEYMAPREVPLPDLPDDVWPNDRKYTQLEGKNFTRGWYEEYAGKKGGDEGELSDFDEKIKKLEERERKKKREAVVKAKPVPTKMNPLAEKVPSTVVARKASSALGSRTGGPPSFAAPTAAVKAKAPGALTSRKPMTGPSAVANPRHTAARVASNTTLGYSKGRSVSAAARRPLGDIHKKDDVKPITTQMPFGGGTTLDQLLGLSLAGQDDNDDLGAQPLTDLPEDDDALADFQLDTPEI